MPEAVVAQTSPFAVELKEGNNYAWCACGRSAKQPFCDGTHKQVGMKPVVFTADKTGTVLLCGCKNTGNKPFCDGTHKTL